MEIYTDGGCSGNPGPGGWAFVIVENGVIIKEENGAEKVTTNNRMELLGVISALRALKKLKNPDGSGEITVYTDSQYVQKGISQWISQWKAKGWRTSSKEPVKNQDLWVRLDELAASFKPVWVWVKGHAGNLWNERCDTLARKAIASIK